MQHISQHKIIEYNLFNKIKASNLFDIFAASLDFLLILQTIKIK